jgi:hypothetical protein
LLTAFLPGFDRSTRILFDRENHIADCSLRRGWTDNILHPVGIGWMSKQIGFFAQEFPQPSDGSVVITLNIKLNRPQFLVSREKGYRYFSKDKEATRKSEIQPDSEDIEKLLDDVDEEEFECDSSRVIQSLANEDVATLDSGEMNRDFSVKFALVFRVDRRKFSSRRIPTAY